MTFGQAALDYFSAHGIDPEIADALGIEGTDKGISIPYRDHMGPITYRRRRDFAARRTFQPVGQSLEIWTPVADNGVLLVCEGESDCMAAISAMYEIAGDALADPDEDDPREILWRRPDLPPPLQGVVPIALPGAGACHTQVADLAAELVADCVVVLDGDDAGRKAAAKLKAKIDAKDNISATTIGLPDGQDLADVLAAADDPTTALAELVAEAEADAEQASVKTDAGDDAPKVEPLAPGSIADLLPAALAFLDRYVVLPGKHERHAVALWVAHAWALDGAHATAYILIVSPEKRSGKTRAMEVLELLVARPWRVTGASEAAMFRKIAKNRPTLLLDEIDAIFGSHSERTEPLRAILNAGNRPGATVARCVGENKDVEDFPIYCAKALAGIDNDHRIPDTIRDRAVTIRMQRKTGAEPVERLRHRTADAEAKPLRMEFEAWAAGAAVDLLLEADPDLPVELDDRAAEAWEPLLAIADLAAGEWPSRARAAAIALSGEEDRDEVTTGTMLLRAIRDAFGDSDRMATVDLLGTINADDELPFGGWREGKGLDGRRLAKLLKPYGVKPRPIRIDGEVAKGYLREQLEEVWQRWLPSSPDMTVTSVTSVTGDAGVTENSALASQCNAVTDVTDKSGSNGAISATEAEEAEAERLAGRFEVAA